MKKFEIINNKWIKLATAYELENEKIVLWAIKISDIKKIKCSEFGEINMYPYYINFYTSSHTSFQLRYKKTEKDEFIDDLAFFEKLLFK